MSSYVFPIQTAFIIFVIASMFLLVPWLIYGYRKDGFFSWSRFVVSFSFIFFLMAAYCLVILPLPATRNNCAGHAANAVYYNLQPFMFVKDIMRETPIIWSQPSTWINMIKGRAFLQVLFNVLLLIPLGVYIRYFWQKRAFWKHAFVAGFGLSLFFEVTQLTGLYGYFSCPYRLFDVDDLMLNTSGAVIGFFTAPLVLALFPSRESIQAKSEQIVEQNRVYPVPQLLALLIDGIVVVIIANLMSIFTLTNDIQDVINTSTAMVIVLFFIPWVQSGVTPGSAVLRFRYVDRQTGTSTLSTLLKRLIAIYAPWLLLTVIQLVSKYAYPNYRDDVIQPYLVWISLGISIVYFLVYIILFIHVLVVIFSGGKRSFYFDEVSRTRASRK
ncbi:Glycopeptide antibiotics resistance protein [Paenibacillus polysaccharolyticus]|uniref:Glycopeptide antibiotics resistance protein n=1 Tax=Paenibacillus polysaccharolyticus TaxID=582692 RepID=A0A1G5J3I0_9BACL|nr:VanZ family protein [Paenibacillus polysaccharolyticus]SCY82817.1 Glycopeptide antibiotics resistance protein [Paenibacillus polysaccharolyticus]